MKSFNAAISRGFLFFLATSCALAQDSGSFSPDMQKSCRDSVQAFYDWYVPKALKNSEMPASDLALRYKAALFSPDLLRALREDSQAQAKAKGEIVGLDFDPFLNAQDPSEHYVLRDVSVKDGRCSVEVYSVTSGKKSAKTAVIPELMFKSGQWVFMNFHYGKSKRAEDENLLSILKTLRADRQKYGK